MTRLRSAPIVEGDGEVACIRILLQRIIQESLGGDYPDVLKPIRCKPDKLRNINEEEICRAVELAFQKLANLPTPDDPSLVLILVDSEGECPRDLAPRILEVARDVDVRADISCVLPHPMYETWFVAAADSLGRYLDAHPAEPPESPEGRLGKGWIKQRMIGPKYEETRHQAAMTQAMDLKRRRALSPSFDKLCRELEKRAKTGAREVR